MLQDVGEISQKTDDQEISKDGWMKHSDLES